MQEGRTFDRENFSKLKVTICGWAQKWREKKKKWRGKNGGKKEAAGVRHMTLTHKSSSFLSLHLTG